MAIFYLRQAVEILHTAQCTGGDVLGKSLENLTFFSPASLPRLGSWVRIPSPAPKFQKLQLLRTGPPQRAFAVSESFSHHLATSSRNARPNHPRPRSRSSSRVHLCRRLIARSLDTGRCSRLLRNLMVTYQAGISPRGRSGSSFRPSGHMPHDQRIGGV